MLKLPYAEIKHVSMSLQSKLQRYSWPQVENWYIKSRCLYLPRCLQVSFSPKLTSCRGLYLEHLQVGCGGSIDCLRVVVGQKVWVLAVALLTGFKMGLVPPWLSCLSKCIWGWKTLNTKGPQKTSFVMCPVHYRMMLFTAKGINIVCCWCLSESCMILLLLNPRLTD